MTTYGSTITLNWEKLSHLGVPKHSHKITHGTCASADVNAIIGRWVIPANPDDSIGSQGAINITMQIDENTTVAFVITFACNNKLENFVTVSSSERVNVHIAPSAEVIKTMAPLDALITFTLK